MTFPLFYLTLLAILPRLILALAKSESSLSCSASHPDCLGEVFNLSTLVGNHLDSNVTRVFENGLLNQSSCAAVSVLFARGTLEIGNVGILTGPPFFAALASYLNTTTSSLSTSNLAIQGVSYPADIPAFFLGGSPIGTRVLSSLINTTLSRCPSIKLIVSGYSQGAQIVHNSLSALPLNITDKISSVVLFGDPKNGTTIQGVASEKVMTFCHAGDDICKGGDQVMVAHLNYSQNAMDAAVFALGGMAQLGITSMKMVREGAGGGLG